MASNDKPPQPNPNPVPVPAASVPQAVPRPAPLPSYYPTQTVPANAVAGPSTLPSQYTPTAAWKNGWTMAAYPYTSAQNITPYPQQQYLYTHPKAPVPIAPSTSATKAQSVNFAQAVELPRTKAPSPPPPEPCKNWDQALKSFLQSVGLTQALRGLELDMFVLNSDWEQKKVPGALQELANSIQVCILRLRSMPSLSRSF